MTKANVLNLVGNGGSRPHHLPPPLPVTTSNQYADGRFLPLVSNQGDECGGLESQPSITPNSLNADPDCHA